MTEALLSLITVIVATNVCNLWYIVKRILIFCLYESVRTADDAGGENGYQKSDSEGKVKEPRRRAVD